MAANDLEQAQSRVFKTMTDLIKRNPALKGSAKLPKRCKGCRQAKCAERQAAGCEA